MHRKQAILLAATEHFGRHGFRGASLRDIARDAGVSLTLLNHHFGSKAGLLLSAVESNQRRLDDRKTAVAFAARRDHADCAVRDLVQAWVCSDIATAATPDGRRFLRLAARIGADACDEFELRVRERLQAPALLFVDALRVCRPEASRRTAEAAWLWMDAAVSRFLLDAHRLSDPPAGAAGIDFDQEDEARLVRFLVAGIDAALDTPTMAAPGHADPPRPGRESALAK